MNKKIFFLMILLSSGTMFGMSGAICIYEKKNQIARNDAAWAKSVAASHITAIEALTKSLEIKDAEIKELRKDLDETKILLKDMLSQVKAQQEKAAMPAELEQQILTLKDQRKTQYFALTSENRAVYQAHDDELTHIKAIITKHGAHIAQLQQSLTPAQKDGLIPRDLEHKYYGPEKK